MFNVAQKFQERLKDVMTDYPELTWREQLNTARDWAIQACHDEIGAAISFATDDLGSLSPPDLTKRENLNVISAEIQGKTILVWSWEDAPLALKKHVSHGGDEDWVALVPKDYGSVSWLEYNSLGWGDNRTFDLPDGRTVYSGAHA